MNIYVGNLPKGTKKRELEKLFEPYGKVVSAAIARDKKSGVSRGFGFVEMANRHEGEQAIAALNHPNIAHVYEFNQQDGLHYIVMEFVEGESLSQRLAREGTISTV